MCNHITCEALIYYLYRRLSTRRKKSSSMNSIRFQNGTPRFKYFHFWAVSIFCRFYRFFYYKNEEKCNIWYMTLHDQTVQSHTCTWLLPKIWKIITENNNNRNGLYFWQIIAVPQTVVVPRGINQTVTFWYTAKYDMILSEVLTFFKVLHEKVKFWEGVVIRCIKSEVLKISWVLHEKVWFWEGVPWGRNLVSSWGNLVIFDIFPLTQSMLGIADSLLCRDVINSLTGLKRENSIDSLFSKVPSAAVISGIPLFCRLITGVCRSTSLQFNIVTWCVTWDAVRSGQGVSSRLFLANILENFMKIKTMAEAESAKNKFIN